MQIDFRKVNHSDWQNAGLRWNLTGVCDRGRSMRKRLCNFRFRCKNHELIPVRDGGYVFSSERLFQQTSSIRSAARPIINDELLRQDVGMGQYVLVGQVSINFNDFG